LHYFYRVSAGILARDTDILAVSARHSLTVSKRCTAYVSEMYALLFQDMLTNFHNVFTVKFRKDLQRTLELKLSPTLKCVVAVSHYLASVSGQLCSFTGRLIQFKVTQRRLITVNVEERCYFFVYTH